MTSRARDVARFLDVASMYFVSGISENETLRPSDGVRVAPGARSAFLRTVRDGVRDLAREDPTLVLCFSSFLTAAGDEAAAEGSSGVSDSSSFTVPFLTQCLSGELRRGRRAWLHLMYL